MNIQLTTVLVSALTSGIVTLGIEWGAKPRLEARKERLLELHRKRQVFRKGMLQILKNAAKWQDFVYSNDLGDEERVRLDDEVERGYQQIDDATKDMADEYVDIALTYPSKLLNGLIARYIGIARGLQLSGRSRDEKAKLLVEVTEPMYTLLFSRHWRFVRRAKALIVLQKLVERYASRSNGG